MDLSAPLPPRVLLYDGVCGLCDSVVQWVLDHDPEGRFHLAPLQGETADALRARHPSIPRDLDTMVVVTTGPEGERVFLRSAAAFQVARALGGWLRPLSWLAILPRPLTDLGYRMVAASRYRLFGKLDACRLPSPSERARFLP